MPRIVRPTDVTEHKPQNAMDDPTSAMVFYAWGWRRRRSRVSVSLAALTVCALLYAAISGVHGGNQLIQEMLASLAFMVVAFLLGTLAARTLAGSTDLDRTAVLLTTWLRDFAVAAVLATQAFGAKAGSVAGVYGALMLLPEQQ